MLLLRLLLLHWDRQFAVPLAPLVLTIQNVCCLINNVRAGISFDDSIYKRVNSEDGHRVFLTVRGVTLGQTILDYVPARTTTFLWSFVHELLYKVHLLTDNMTLRTLQLLLAISLSAMAIGQLLLTLRLHRLFIIATDSNFVCHFGSFRFCPNFLIITNRYTHTKTI